ncbi:hypothetical protein, partial [Candidatus Borrarchaeum sp.]|uniref:hypothetical protein n=1 Tax=Candidatus Borrarchaeum sp. TaxID=2846742 RepID=UPI00257CE6F7
MNKRILLIIVLLMFSTFIFPVQHAFSNDNATQIDEELLKSENTVDEIETPQYVLTLDDFEEIYEQSSETVEEWAPFDIPPHIISYNGSGINHLALDSNTTNNEELNITITHPLNGTILATKYVNATWNATGDFDYFEIELDNVTKGNTTDTFYYLEIPEGWHTLKITGYSGNLSVFDSVIFDPIFGGGSYELRLHIIEDVTKEDYSYCWVKLANEHWNKTAYGQADINGEITFTEIAAGNYYVEIYPPTPSEVYGMRMYCKNITISGDLSLGIEVYDYRGTIAMAWDLKYDETNMTQYILDRMEGCGAQEGDIIQINVAWKYPLSPINSKWGKDNFRDLIISLKKEGYRIWIEPRLIYCGSTMGYSFWTQLDNYTDSGYADGDYYNEDSGRADFRAHNAFMQFEARMKSLENEGPTGDISVFLGDVSICLKQKDYWDVYDVNDAQYLTYGNGHEQWSFDNETCILTIHDATHNHLYEIYYMEGYHRIGAPIGNYDDDPYFVRDKLLELMNWYYENCTLPNGECAIDGIHPNYGDTRALGVWNAWNQGWSGMVTKKVIDWFLGNYTQYKDDFKLSWVTFEENSAFPRGRNDSLPFMNDWLYFRQKLIHNEWYKLLINQAKNHNVSVILYDGDDNRLQSSDLAIRLGADIFEHQKGTNIDDEYFINYVDYWSTRVPFMNDWEETWQDDLDHEGLRATLQRTSAQGTLPAIMYNHQSPYGYNIPEDRYDDYRQAHEDFREVWKTYKQFSDRKIAKVYFMVGVSARQISDFYGAADGTRMTPRLYHKSLFFRLPAQLDFISTYYIEENGIPDDCDLLVIAGQNTGSPDTTYHSLYSDKLNSSVTSYVMDGGAVWFMGDVGRYSTNGTSLGTGYWEQLLGLQCVNASWDEINDNFFVDESHWIINDEEYRGLVDNSEGYQPDLPNMLGEPE